MYFFLEIDKEFEETRYLPSWSLSEKKVEKLHPHLITPNLLCRHWCLIEWLVMQTSAHLLHVGAFQDMYPSSSRDLQEMTLDTNISDF